MTGFLNDLKLKDASTDPNKIPEGKYPAIIKDLQTKVLKDKGNTLIITYQISHEDPEYGGKTKPEFKRLPVIDEETGKYATSDDERDAAFLKQRILSFGVPEDELDTMNKNDLLGTPLWIELVQSANGQYINVKNVELREEETGAQVL